jgi:hypothetical protein
VTRGVYIDGLGEVEADCQYRKTEKGAACGRPATVYRPDRLFIRFLCTECAAATNRTPQGLIGDQS